jgi:hypothetical protein
MDSAGDKEASFFHGEKGGHSDPREVGPGDRSVPTRTSAS